jgi:hypothetical protein
LEKIGYRGVEMSIKKLIMATAITAVMSMPTLVLAQASASFDIGGLTAACGNGDCSAAIANAVTSAKNAGATAAEVNSQLGALAGSLIAAAVANPAKRVLLAAALQAAAAQSTSAAQAAALQTAAAQVEAGNAGSINVADATAASAG